MAGPVRISILADGARARRELGDTGRAGERMGRAFRSAGKVAAIGLGGLTAGAAAFAAVSVQSLQRIERIGAQTDQTIRSTGGVANVTRKQIDDLAGSLEAVTATEAESITEGANMLLTFTNIRNGVGESNHVFDQAVVALTDMTRALDNTGGSTIDTRKQAIQLGKALNDPIKGVTALRKVGVSFTEDQTKTIKKLVETGDTMKAQKIILAELTKEFGGSGEAFAKTTAGKIELAKHELGTMGETITAQLLPPLAELATVGLKGLQWATDFGNANIAPKFGELVDFVKANKDEAVDFAKAVGTRVLPTLESLGDLAVDTGQRMYEIGRPIAEDVLPLLGDLVDLTGDVADAINGLPGPVKDFGVQVGFAALALGPLRAGITATTGAMLTGTAAATGYYRAIRYGAASSQSAAVGAARLGSAAKNVAGIGGILALTASLTKAKDEGNSFGSVMTGVAGGAGIGAMFGPVGALIGAGVGGGLSALVGSFAQTEEEARAARLELLKTEGFKNAKEDADSLREALRGVVNAYGDTVRAAVSASFTGKEGKLDADIAKLRSLGVSMDTIVSATLGQADAQRVVDRALGGSIAQLKTQADEAKAAYEAVKNGQREVVDQSGRVIGKQQLSNDEVKIYRDEANRTADALKAATIEQDTFNKRVSANGAALEDRRTQLRGLAADLGITTRQYLAFPTEVRTKFESDGLPQTRSDALRLIRGYKELQGFRQIKAIVSAPGVQLTRGQINDLARRYKLTPRQVKTLVKAEGVRATVREIDGVGKAFGRSSKTKVDLAGPRRSLSREIKDLEFVAGRGGLRVKKGVEDPVSKTRINLSRATSSVRSGLEPAKSAARSGGVGIGANAKLGFGAGFAGADGQWSAQVRSAVRAAINAGRSEAAIRSPSRKTAYIGDMMGRGLERGLARSKPRATKAGRDVVAAALKGINLGTSGIEAAIGRARALIDKEIARALANDKRDVPGKRKGRTQAVVDKEIKALEKLSATRRNRIIKGLNDEFAALRRNGKEQDRNAAKLGKARERYKQLVEEARAYAADIKTSFVNFGNVLSLGEGTGFSSSTQLVDRLRGRVEQAKQFATLIRQLTSAGLNKTTIQQLLDAGPEAAFGSVQAIASGGASAIREINTLTAQLASAGGSLGATMSDRFKDAGIQAAAGLVAGLEKEQKRLDTAAARIGSQIVRAIRRELGIKSPSRVFRRVGEDTMAGLALGLDETYARRLGAGVGRGVQEGFARPTLTADLPAARAAAATPAQNITVHVHVAPGGDPISTGREITRALDAYRRHGGRSTA